MAGQLKECDNVTMTNTPHHFRRLLKLAEMGVFDKPNYTNPKETIDASQTPEPH